VIIVLLALFISTNISADNINMKAYADLNFGDSFSTIKDKCKNSDEIEIHFDKAFVKIEDVDYQLIFYLYEDQLIQIICKGETINGDFGNSELNEQRDKLVDKISAIYGPPTDVNNSNYQWVGDFYMQYTDKWLMGNKHIYVGLCKDDMDYFNSFIIRHVSMYNEAITANKISNF